MRKLFTVAAALAACSAAPALAQALSTGAGDGSVNVTVRGAGAFGSNVGGGATNAIYDPIGATPFAGTTYESYVYLRTGTAGGSRLNLSTVAAITSSSSITQISSTFSSSGLDFRLVQDVSALFDSSNVRSGSLLTQAYSFTNTTGSDLVVELTRYVDGDLQFNGTITDGGGRLILDGMEVLFETDAAIGSANSNTFLGIFNMGGTSTGFEVNQFSGLRSAIEGGVDLGNIVENDGVDADQFIDTGQGYDVTLGLGRLFTLGAGQSAVFTTGTIFGTGAPDDVIVTPPTPVIPEPATWAAMVLGFGLVGAAARRRRSLGLA